ncbi:MAG: MFS transporter [Rikenellaceae bacterium]|nr:MFS transporter [Rikenellaceae bacterium]
MKQKSILLALLPVMATFFVMGFVDLVGTAANYVKEDFGLSDTMANTLPTMVFFWFLVFSVPTGMLMNRIGRRKTVLLSLVVTLVALVIPLINYSFPSMLVSFAFLGIGNTLMQVSLNPLLSNIVSGSRLASSLTFGQFVKAIASFLAPIIAAWSAARLGDWKYLFPIFMSVALLATAWLGVTGREEEDEKSGSSLGSCLKLLTNPVILLSFLGIMCHVGIDVGTNVTAPKILIERLGFGLNDAVIATSVYFIFRTAGCFLGTFILAIFSAKRFFAVSVAMMAVAVAGLFVFDSLWLIYGCIALIGLGNSNIFPIILSKALLYMPEKKNEVSGLMVMGVFGGAVFPPVMGITSDALSSQAGALIILGICVAYLFVLTFTMKEISNKQ